MSEAAYIPDNPALARVLNTLPPGLRRYHDHARLLLHFISAKKWLGDVDRKGYARLHSAILRKYIPNAVLGPLKAHLCSLGVITTDPYAAGCRSTGYRIGADFDGSPRRIVLADSLLVNKLQDWRERYSSLMDPAPEDVIERRRDILAHMRNDLDRIHLAKPVDKIVQDVIGDGVDPDHALYACTTIHHDDHAGLKMDAFGFRVHSIVTRTATPIRNFLRIDGNSLIELDVANAQPLILAIALQFPETWTTYIANGQHIGEGLRRPCAVAAAPLCIDGEEIRKFTLLCENGLLYESLRDSGGFRDRETAKSLLFRDVLFGRPYVCGRMTKLFAREYPTCFHAVQEIKRKHGYKAIAQVLQRLESTIIIDGVCGRLVREHPEMSFLTIHDSALAVADAADTVHRIMSEGFDRYGVRPTIRKKMRKERH